jgi:hypothetical protein
MPRPVGGDECSDFKNPIGRTFLSGNRLRLLLMKNSLLTKYLAFMIKKEKWRNE